MNPGLGEMATTTEPMTGQAMPVQVVDPEQAKRKRMMQMLAMGMMNGNQGQGQGMAGGIGQIVQALMMKKMGGM